jgi:CTP:molybdopterin cytidylyltransferase MocA
MGAPKALLEFGGETFLDRLVGLLGRHCAPVIVVLGAGADEIRARAARLGQASVVVNPEYARGMSTSLSCGLRAAPPDSTGVLFTLVDHPAVREATVAALAGGAGDRFRIPRYRGRRGHPVYIPARLAPEFLAIPEGGSPRDVIERHRARIDYVDEEDPGILIDIDDPEAYRRLAEGVTP